MATYLVSITDTFFSVSFFTADRVHGPSKAILEGLSDHTAVSESMNEGSSLGSLSLVETVTQQLF